MFRLFPRNFFKGFSHKSLRSLAISYFLHLLCYYWRTFLLSFGGDDGKIASLEKKNKERSFKRRTVYSSGQGLSMTMRLEC